MDEQWRADVPGGPVVVDAAAACALVLDRQARGELMTWFASSRGRLIAFGSNGARVMLMLLNGPGDPGEHAISPTASGESTGYVLHNKQVDTYADADTIPLPEALENLASIVDSGLGLPRTTWSDDR